MQPFGYAWLQLAHPLASFPTMLQLAEFGKEYLVSGWVMLVNMAVWRIFESGMSHKNVRFAVAAFLLFVFSLLRHGTPIVTHPHAITLAQPGFDMAFEQSLEAQRTEAFRMAVYEKSARQPTELIVFPEGIADDWKSFGISAPAPVLFGGLREDKYQTSFLVSKDQIQYLDKTRLVMFGEYVPLRDKFSFLQNFKLGTNDFIPGETDKVLSAGTLRIAPLICFEAIFSEPAGRRAALGANLLTVQSIDDWYRNTRASELLADATVFRSIETGLPCVRVGGLGISQVTDSRGNLLARLPYGEPEVARIQVPIPESGNPWHFGNWIWQICGVICVFLALYDAKKRRTDEKSPLVAESQTK
jgi:apolipoprotein N-acyltransferase